MRLDLHMHSTVSDGTWSPSEVVQGAVDGGLDVISLTDHDTVAGLQAARAAAAELRIQVIAGIEVSSTYQGRDVHVLGYFVDPTAEALVSHQGYAARRREHRMREMVDRLRAAGVEVEYDDVVRAAGPDVSVIGRPHLAAALVEAGHVASVNEAFYSLIGDGSEAFVPTRLLEPSEAVRIVRESSGIPMWAHPPADLVEPLLPTLLEAGLRGLEVYRPRHKRGDVLRLEEICRARGLLMSGGSDWHGPEGGSSLGDFHVDAREIEALLTAGGL